MSFITSIRALVTPGVSSVPAPATSPAPDRFAACLSFSWRPDCDGQPLHTTAHDAGGATSWGVTLATYTAWRIDHGHPAPTVADLAAATKDELAALLRVRFWNPIQADHLPPGVDLLAWDFGFMSGPPRSAKLLQELVGVVQDGAIGPATLAAVARQDRLSLIRHLGARHEAFYRSLDGFPNFGRGWLRRSGDRLAIALKT